MNGLADDQASLLRLLLVHGVEFVVIGGVAAQLHGWGGATADLDIAVSVQSSNVDRLNDALAAAGAGLGTIGGLGTSFMTDYGRLEIVRKAHAVGGYADWLRSAQRHTFEHLTIMVAAPQEILRSKEAAGRQKDREALPEMRRAFDRHGPPDARS